MKLTVTAFITAIDADYPNVFTSAQKVAWLNRAKTELYKWAGLEASDTIATVADQDEYDIDPTIEFEQIHHVNMELSDGGRRVVLTPKARGEALTAYSYYKTTEGKIAIYPTPKIADLEITIYYTSKPADYASDAAGLAVEIALTDDGLIAAQDYVISKMAMANDDIDKANNYRMDYNAKLVDLKMQKYKRIGKYPSTKDVMKHSQKYNRLARTGRGTNPYYVPTGE
jgi:hypothetical protein